MRFVIYSLGPLIVGVCAAGLTIVMVACSYVVVRVYRALEPGTAALSPTRAGGRPPLILPGRLT